MFAVCRLRLVSSDFTLSHADPLGTVIRDLPLFEVVRTELGVLITRFITELTPRTVVCLDRDSLGHSSGKVETRESQ
jgi:hypothetical protein